MAFLKKSGACVMGALFAIQLTACHKLTANESQIAEMGPCDPSRYNAGGCSQGLDDNNSSLRTELDFGLDQFQRFGQVQGGRVTLPVGDTVFAEFQFAMPGQSTDITTLINTEYVEIQRRHQEWKNSGFGGLERKRVWVDDGRSQVQVQLYIDVNGTKYHSTQYDTRDLGASDWSENFDYLGTWLGPMEKVFSGNLWDGYRDAINGLFHDSLKIAWRSFGGVVDSPIIGNISPGHSANIRIGAIVKGTGVARVAPFKLTLQTYQR